MDKIIELANKYKQKYKDWRYGQAIFNAAYELYPEETNELRATEFDCFYVDSRVDVFLEELNKKIKK